jgi:hypothetical protein
MNQKCISRGGSWNYSSVLAQLFFRNHRIHKDDRHLFEGLRLARS